MSMIDLTPKLFDCHVNASLSGKATEAVRW